MKLIYLGSAKGGKAVSGSFFNVTIETVHWGCQGQQYDVISEGHE